MKPEKVPFYAGMEAGGTKFVCMVASGPEDVRAQTSFSTTKPEETLGRALAFFMAHEPFGAMGIGTFGPCNLNPDSPAYGRLSTSIKPGWKEANMLEPFRQVFDVPMGIDTDVNVAALGEYTWRAGQGTEVLLYLTVGTGIGGGGIINGRMMHGLFHPEMGHIRVPRFEGDRFPGICPYHGDCLQGLASGPAMEARWGKKAADLPIDHPSWRMEAYYLASAVNNYICTLSPNRIILGGGVMNQKHLFPLIREEAKRLLNGYIQLPLIMKKIEEYIVPPGLGDRAGVLGAIALARQKAEGR
ncbi:MAG: ROK family protein [Syntrophaceae bacterium]|nr:ROK family protein [Syntrophaceae bacterium]